MNRTIAWLLYGCGLRINECVSLRVHNVDLDGGVVRVTETKGGKQRILSLPKSMREPIEVQLESSKLLYESDRLEKIPGVKMPGAMENGFGKPAESWKWFWLFPSLFLSEDPRTGIVRRHHAHAGSFGNALREAAKAAGFQKRISAHTFRHSFATEMFCQEVLA